MLSLKDFKATKIDSTNLVVGGSGDPNETPGGSQGYNHAIMGPYRKVWESDYHGHNGLEYCNVYYVWGV
ncbi:MAG: hypothetical protein EA362_00125 [Saprospirales bacterium]|nr:MAG: hypothetical protein EA362_00125 [Saprospirales bacterium]